MNLDFADVRSVMKGMGEAMMGTGRAEGENRAIEAAKAAISSPLLENVDINGSKAVLVNVLGREVGLEDTASAMQYIQDAAGPNAHVIFGYGNDESMGDTLQVTVIATGFNPDSIRRHPAAVVEVAAPVDQPVEEETVVEETVVEETWESTPSMADEFNEVAATIEAARPQVTEADDRVSALMDDLTEVMEDKEAAQVAESPGVFLARAAAGGGADVVMPSEPASAAVPEEPVQSFLRPVGTQSIGEVERPAWPARPSAVNRSVAAGIGPDNPKDDLMAPAYTRKYMD